ncbi:hypothetical protein [Streptomyces sp. NPDC058424]|uniref:hypothetical protein n=1 Tax=Streptomyces sp. NPDC058424 TaxID=3346491 RepID=UPI00364C6DD6
MGGEFQNRACPVDVSLGGLRDCRLILELQHRGNPQGVVRARLGLQQLARISPKDSEEQNCWFLVVLRLQHEPA